MSNVKPTKQSVASDLTLGRRSGAMVSILVPGTAEEGPQWHCFHGIDNRDVVFSVAVPMELGAFAAMEKKLIINPNAAIVVAFDDSEMNSPEEA